MSIKQTRNMTLCMLCQRFAGGCAWSKDFKAVEGWTARVTYKKNGKIDRAWVGWCPSFRADAGLYDLFMEDPRKGRWYIIKHYGYITEVRYATIRYHLVNDYERNEKDNTSKTKNNPLSLRQFNEAVKRNVQNAKP